MKSLQYLDPAERFRMNYIQYLLQGGEKVRLVSRKAKSPLKLLNQ